MGNLDLLLGGLQSAATPENLLYAAIGVLLGTFVGVLPGIGPAMAVALLLPVTFSLEPTSAFIMFAGIYYGGMYGGSTTSILLNTPGESASVMTALEGNKMAKAGRAAQALATAAIGSFIAGTIGTLLVALFAPALAEFAVTIGSPSYFAILLFALVMTTTLLGSSKVRGFLALFAPALAEFAVTIGSPSYFAILLFALVMTTTLLGSSKVRGFLALFLGLTIGLVGLDLNTGQARLSLGVAQLRDPLEIVAVAVGIFALGEAFWVAAHLRRKPLKVIPVGRPWMGRDDWRRSWKPWLRGTAYGFPFGAIPAGGAEIPTFLSYVTERRLSRHSDEFGKGAIEGVAGPEAANNASAAGMFVPLLAMGIPVTATASVMLAALTSYGIQPGPQLMTEQSDLVWTLLASLLIGNTLLLVLNLPLAPLWAKLLRIPRPQLYAGILFFACLGAFATNQDAFDIFLLLVFGLLGLAMRRFGLPVLPLILGVILGPIMELKLREALTISDGDLSGLWSEPLAVAVYLLTALVIVVPIVLKRVRPDVDTPSAEVAHARAEEVSEQDEERVQR
jgi:putative tricarboxylic transport membrane protein